MDIKEEYKNLIECISAEIEFQINKESEYNLESLLRSIDDRFRFLNLQEKYLEDNIYVHNVSKKGMGEIWRICHEGDVDYAIKLFINNKRMKCDIDGDVVNFGSKLGVKICATEKIKSKYGLQNIYIIDKEKYSEYDYYFLFDEKIFWGWCSKKLVDEIGFSYKNNLAITQKTCYNGEKSKGIYEKLIE